MFSFVLKKYHNENSPLGTQDKGTESRLEASLYSFEFLKIIPFQAL